MHEKTFFYWDDPLRLELQLTVAPNMRQLDQPMRLFLA
jgi:hypothetical protein